MGPQGPTRTLSLLQSTREALSVFTTAVAYLTFWATCLLYALPLKTPITSAPMMQLWAELPQRWLDPSTPGTCHRPLQSPAISTGHNGA
ncbi:hypothetical protein AAFF_G00228440 [Aldrovandia affinis]|uniref:Uncharacterized protein n=1 Tax=Aldrovandia affinis TaxID=143900 RepID=A0AAD7SWB1_9TELE|nr:hypothetical protein AAFF_G00228440 [Aldrovandia affinis]